MYRDDTPHMNRDRDRNEGESDDDGHYPPNYRLREQRMYMLQASGTEVLSIIVISIGLMILAWVLIENGTEGPMVLFITLAAIVIIAGILEYSKAYMKRLFLLR